MEFFDSVLAGDLDGVRDLLEKDPSLLQTRDAEGATGLHRAALAGNREMALLLIDAGADVNAPDGRFGATPAGWAIEHLRGRGGLLAIEIEDAKFAIERRDAVWLGRLIERFPALKTARDENGAPLSALAQQTGDASLSALF